MKMRIPQNWLHQGILGSSKNSFDLLLNVSYISLYSFVKWTESHLLPRLEVRFL